MIVGANGENVGKFIELCGNQIREDCMNKETMAKLGKALKDFEANDALKPLMEKAYNSLKPLQQKRIQNAINLA